MSSFGGSEYRFANERGKDHYRDSEDALLHADECSHFPQQAHTGRVLCLILTLVNAAMLFTTTLLVSLVRRDSPMRNAALRVTSVYSPVLDDIDVRLIDTPINGSLLPGDSPSPWRGIPSPATATAWDQSELIRTMPLTKEQITLMGKDPERVAKFDDRFGLGDNAYVGALDIFHQVHCLNLLRRGAFSTYGLPPSTPVPHVSKLDWVHLQHCTDMLMQHLLCTADAGMITYQWREDHQHPFPDFGVHRVCRDWTQLVEYRDAHAVDLEMYVNYTKPEDVEAIKETPEYWALIAEVDSENEHSTHAHGGHGGM